MEKEEIEKLAEEYAKQMDVVSVIDEIELENAYKSGFKKGYQKAQQEAKIIEGMKMDEYLASKDLTWKDSPMTLNQVYDIAKSTTSFSEFKAAIDKHYNGTPETVVDLSEYVLTKKEKPFCTPPNITECKQAIYPDYDCNKCKWKH